MRIGIFTDAFTPIVSGVSVSLEILSAELRKLGHEVIVITNSHENAVECENTLRVKGYKFPMKGMNEYRFSRVSRKRVKEIGELNLDLVHCHTEFTMGRLGRRAARKFNLPVVHTYHTMYEDYVHFVSKTFSRPLRFLSKCYSKSFANSADEVIFPTIKVKRTFDRYGYKGHGHIIPTGIYLEQFRKINFKQTEIDKTKESLGIKKDDFVMIFLGRISREKSIEDLILEFSKIKKKNLKLLFVGGGPDMQVFKDLANKLGVLDKVIFSGMVPPNEVGLYYQLGDLFVNFSVSETQGLTYYEALASGVPLLVKYDDNLEDVIVEDYNGFSFKNNEDFVKLFEKLDSNPVLLSKLTQNANKAIEKYSAETYARKCEAIYKKLVK
jgi:1,2-diacylglycerol 3-alpha-glucosyltransferase